jgi:hypothetical protein
MFGQGFPFSGFGGAGNNDSDDDDGKNIFNLDRGSSSNTEYY